MRIVLIMVLILVSVSFSNTATQTDWSGEAGIPGPVTDWENSYDVSTQVNATICGILQLVSVSITPIEHMVDGDFSGANSVFAADIDSDGDMDILGAAQIGDDITWWENTDGTGIAWIEHTVDLYFNGARSVYATDVDSDGDIDVLGAANFADDITWWENTDGTGAAWIEHTVDGDFDGAASVFAADVDGDGDMDVLGAAYAANDIAWWENTDGTGTAWIEHTLDADLDGAISVYAADINNDGNIDVLGAAHFADDITWWENTDGTGTAWIEHTVDADFPGAISVYAADINDDGDIDVLGAAYYGDNITWWENIDGIGTAWIEHIVDGDFNGADLACAVDIDSDGDLDIVGSAQFADDITWWENTDGTGTAWIEHTVDGDFDGARSAYATDIDGNGDIDILGAAIMTNDIVWWDVIGYMGDGVLESSILDAGSVSTWEQFTSNLQAPLSTSVAYQFRSSLDAGDMGAWSDTVNSASTSLSGILANSTSYLQYRVILNTSDPLNTPLVEDVSFIYTVEVGIGESGSGDIISWELLPLENPSYGHLSAIIVVPELGLVDLQVYDVIGRVVAGTSQEFQNGIHTVNFHGLSQGVYFCVMQSGDYTATERVVLLR